MIIEELKDQIFNIIDNRDDNKINRHDLVVDLLAIRVYKLLIDAERDMLNCCEKYGIFAARSMFTESLTKSDEKEE